MANNSLQIRSQSCKYKFHFFRVDATARKGGARPDMASVLMSTIGRNFGGVTANNGVLLADVVQLWCVVKLKWKVGLWSPCSKQRLCGFQAGMKKSPLATAQLHIVASRQLTGRDQLQFHTDLISTPSWSIKWTRWPKCRELSLWSLFNRPFSAPTWSRNRACKVLSCHWCWQQAGVSLACVPFNIWLENRPVGCWFDWGADFLMTERGSHLWLRQPDQPSWLVQVVFLFRRASKIGRMTWSNIPDYTASSGHSQWNG